jgi:hypothetical protein
MPDLAQQSLDVLKLNYPSLVDGDKVRLKASRQQASWVNRLTLGLAGQRDDVLLYQPQTTLANLPAPTPIAPATTP